MTYDFTIVFDLPVPSVDPAGYLDALYEAGCDDATVGVGEPGSIELDFTREASSAEEAMSSAVADVLKAIPGAKPGRAMWCRDEVMNRALKLQGSCEAALQWMRTPAPALDGNTPLDALATPDGAELVMDLLTRLEHGVYT